MLSEKICCALCVHNVKLSYLFASSACVLLIYSVSAFLKLKSSVNLTLLKHHKCVTAIASTSGVSAGLGQAASREFRIEEILNV